MLPSISSAQRVLSAMSERLIAAGVCGAAPSVISAIDLDDGLRRGRSESG